MGQVSCEIALRWLSLDLADDKSKLVQVMAWCRQATSHYLSQCWPRSLSPYGVTGPQWVKRLISCNKSQDSAWFLLLQFLLNVKLPLLPVIAQCPLGTEPLCEAMIDRLVINISLNSIWQLVISDLQCGTDLIQYAHWKIIDGFV